MPDPLSAFVDQRSTLLQQISELGDFQPGSIISASRSCGSPQLPLRQTQRSRTRPSFSAHPEDRWQDG